MKATERAKMLKEENKKFRSLLIRLRRDLNYLKKQRYNSTIPLVLIGVRIKEINEATLIHGGKS